jgi:hypothetical protein
VTTPLDELLVELSYVAGKDRARQLVADALDDVAGRIDVSDELRDLTDDHMGDINLATNWLRGLAKGLRP